MLTFAFEEPLFKFQFARPAFVPLFQFPPKKATRTLNPFYDRVASD